MSALNFMSGELAAAIRRGVRQCVVLGSNQLTGSAWYPVRLSRAGIEMFYLTPTAASLAHALEEAEFDQMKASLFVWLGSAGYRTIDAVVASFGFIASLPKGSGVVFDYVVERTLFGSITSTALDALASRIPVSDGIKYLIQPQAVSAMLRGMGFRQIVEAEDTRLGGGRLVSASL